MTGLLQINYCINVPTTPAKYFLGVNVVLYWYLVIIIDNRKRQTNGQTHSRKEKLTDATDKQMD